MSEQIVKGCFFLLTLFVQSNEPKTTVEVVNFLEPRQNSLVPIEFQHSPIFSLNANWQQRQQQKQQQQQQMVQERQSQGIGRDEQHQQQQQQQPVNRYRQLNPRQWRIFQMRRQRNRRNRQRQRQQQYQNIKLRMMLSGEATRQTTPTTTTTTTTTPAPVLEQARQVVPTLEQQRLMWVNVLG